MPVLLKNKTSFLKKKKNYLMFHIQYVYYFN